MPRLNKRQRELLDRRAAQAKEAVGLVASLIFGTRRQHDRAADHVLEGIDDELERITGEEKKREAIVVRGEATFDDEE